jgi:hypothetical protein
MRIRCERKCTQKSLKANEVLYYVMTFLLTMKETKSMQLFLFLLLISDPL